MRPFFRTILLPAFLGLFCPWPGRRRGMRRPPTFPQRPVTVERNAEWTAPDVYLGEETIARPQSFRIFAVLVDAAYSETIKTYIASGSNLGLDITSWPREHCKIISHVTVTRTTADRIGCGAQ